MDSLVQLFAGYSSSGNALFIPLMLLIAFLAGIIASLSPCTLGILPLIIGYVGGYSKAGNKKLFIQMLSFSIGLSAVLSIIGIICALTGKAFTGVSSPVLFLLFGSIMVILGLNLLGFIEINFPAIVKKMPQNKSGGLFIYPFLVGIFFALAASPCASPILASIMALAAVSGNIIFSISLLFMFALGQCIIIILIAIILTLAGLYIYYRVFSNIN